MDISNYAYQTTSEYVDDDSMDNGYGGDPARDIEQNDRALVALDDAAETGEVGDDDGPLEDGEELLEWEE